MSHDDAWMYLIRHGVTASNEAGVLQGRGVDGPLSKNGRLQIAQTAEALIERSVTAAYSSPLRRAAESAEIIAARLKLAVQTVDGLAEVDVGRWEGLTWEEIKQRDPAAYGEFMNSAGACGYPDGESYASVAERVTPVLNQLLADNMGRSIVVVAHSVVNRVFLARVLGLPAASAREISQSNGCINVVRLRNREVRAMTINAALHVAETS